MSVGVKYFGTVKPGKDGKGVTMPIPVERKPFNQHNPVSFKTGKHLGLRPWPPDGTADGQVLVWNSTKREWVVGAATSSGTEITVITGWEYVPNSGGSPYFKLTTQVVKVADVVGDPVEVQVSSAALIENYSL
jgi:hypothetical protein